MRRPLSPAASISRPAESPAGLRNTLPADGSPSGWCAWRQRRMSSSRALIVSGSAGLRPNVASTTMSRARGRTRRAVLEPAVAVGQAEVGRGHARLGAVGGEDARRLEHAGDVRLVRAGVGPHRAADRARDGQPELEAGQAGPLRLGRGARHLDAGFGRVALAVDARALGPDLDDQAADARIGDDQVAAPPEDDVREPARAGEADQGAQLEGVVDRREQVGRAADAHRREPGERLVARRLDPDPALDVGAGRDRVEARDHAPDPRASRSMPAASGNGAPCRGGEDELGHGVGRAGPAERPRRGRHPGVCQRVVEQLRRVEQGVGVERLVLDQPGGAGLDQARRVRALVAGGVRIRARRPSAGRGRSPRPASRSRPGRRPGRPRPARPASRRAGTGTAGSAAGRPRAGPREPASAAA